MDGHTLQQLLIQAFTLAIVFSALPLFGTMLVGLIVSVFQAATQLQEQTLSFVPKLAVVSASIFFGGPWFSREMSDLFSYIFTLLEKSL